MMYVVGLEATFSATPPVDADGVAEFIETVCDALDETGLIPSVRTSGAGASFQMMIEVVVEGDEVHALDVGIAAITKALSHANVQLPDVHPSELHPSVRELEPA